MIALILRNGKKTSRPFGLVLLLLLMANSVLGQQVDLSKKVTLQGNNQTIEQILLAIGSQSDLAFSYSKKSINAGREISIHAENLTVNHVLTELQEKAGIEYVIVEQQIVLKPIKIQKTKQAPRIERHTLSGYVKDKKTGENLMGATVFITGSGQGTITNEFGFFSLSMPAGKYHVEFSYIGYQRIRKSINLNKNERLELALEVRQTSLPKIILSVKEHHSILSHNMTGKMELSLNDMKKIPEFGGEVGLVKSLQTLPGVKTHSDGSAYFFVRGGNKDQNFVLIDDAPVYNHAHLFGFFSIFVPEFTREITVYKNDIPVNQGDRLSSLIDIRTKDGNLHKWGLTGIFNPLVSTIAFEGPIKKERTSIFASLRHSNFDWVYKNNFPNLDVHFRDFHFKFNSKLNKNNRLYFTIFNGEDVVENFNIDNGFNGGINWKNTTFTTRWNHIFNEKLFLNTLIYTSGYQYIFRYNDLLWTSAIANASIKTDFANYITPDLTLRFGFNQNIHAFNPGNISREHEITFLPKIPKNQSREKVLYLSADHNITEKLSYKAGFRLPMWTNLGPTTTFRFDENYEVSDTLTFGANDAYETFITFDPRLSIKYAPNENTTIKASYGRYHQFMQMLSNSTTPFTSLDVWLPSSANIKPQESHQFSVGYYHFLKKYRLEFSAEAYYKNMRHQIDYKPHANMLLNPLVEGELRFGDAWSYGLELLLKKPEGRLTGWAGYTYSRVFQITKGINGGNKYPAFHDRPEDFSIFLSYKVNQRMSVSANWLYYTGSAISTPIGFFEYNGHSAPIYGDKNNDRLPNYHRLDIAMNFKLNKQKRKYQHELNLSIYNLYFRKNPIFLNFNKVLSADGKLVVPADIYQMSPFVSSQTFLAQFVPSLTYKFKI